MTSEPIFVLPGDEIEPSLIPSHPKKPLKIGPGLRHVPPNEIIPTVAGQLTADHNKNTIRVEISNGRYTPRTSELVIGTVLKSAAEMYQVLLTPYTTPTMLPHLSFESATKKTRPHLDSGSLVYARVSLADKHMDAELECVSSATGKAEGLGPLVGGMLYEISLGMSRRLMMPAGSKATLSSPARVVVLDELATAGLQFETATGRNGRFWVDSEKIATVIAVGEAVKQTDEKELGVEGQKKLVRKLLRELTNGRERQDGESRETSKV